MHMTMHSDWLYDKIPPPISTIKVANDEKLLVEACGNINLNVADSNGKINTIQVQNVLYVPGLATNLLSVTQMIKNGCHIQFNEKGCKILNRNKEQVATAKMMNNMYRLNTHSTPAYISASKDNDFQRNYALLPLSESVSEPKTNDDSSTNETQLENTSEDSELQSETSDESFKSDEGSIYEPDQTIDPTELTRNVTTRSKQRTCNMDAKTYSCVNEVSEQDDVPESYTAAISSHNVHLNKVKNSLEIKSVNSDQDSPETASSSDKTAIVLIVKDNNINNYINSLLNVLKNKFTDQSNLSLKNIVLQNQPFPKKILRQRSPLQRPLVQSASLPSISIDDPHQNRCTQMRIQCFMVKCKNLDPECIRQCTLEYFTCINTPKVEEPYNLLHKLNLTEFWRMH
ncbi:unnamed protein product [Arctia plantaginis]|uniref:Retrovirus-related Pol polyprotein from transposon TNT 1-94-like beta-barrel domain-containing protein n=1 Tax=Arctia plantaginis TaxID=874455 RepID=A0A8S1B381_ARCPL|nr:unnamed protein product [Arctia plantaginis]